MAPLRGEFYDGKQPAYLTPGSIGRDGEPYPVPAAVENVYSVVVATTPLGVTAA